MTVPRAIFTVETLDKVPGPPSMPLSEQIMHSPHVLSHRGYHLTAAENTIDAFLEAAGMGVYGIETDVRCSSDGRLVLFHDRVAPDGSPVASLTQQELSNLAGYEVPLLEDALDAIPNLFWNIEIKTPAAVPGTRNVVGRFAQRTRILITSFWHDIIKEFSDIPRIECGILVAHHPGNTALVPSLLTHTPISTVVWDYEILNLSLVQAAAACNVRSWVYGAQTRSEHGSCVRCGVDGIITDFPEYAFAEVDHADPTANPDRVDDLG